MVGGVCALIGAAMVGPRIGKFVRDKKSGKVTKVNAFPGHNLPLGCLGVFILWLGWYGFNGAAAVSLPELGSIFVTTTISPAVATVVCMIFTWLKYGKPDVSMCLNASLAGLVAITASCDVCDAGGSIVIGAVAGLLVIFGVWLLDHKLHIDDPVGAVAVHCLNGIWGTVAVGLFATGTAPAFARGIGDGVTFGANQIAGAGLFYGGGFGQLGIQLVGMFATIGWTVVTITIAFLIIKKLFGLRVTAEEELVGLDRTEHGLPSAYADFAPAVAGIAYGYDAVGEDSEDSSGYAYSSGTGASAGTVPGPEAAGGPVYVTGDTPPAEAIPVQKVESFDSGSGGHKFTKIEIVCKESRFDDLKAALVNIGITGMTVSHVLGCGAQKGAPEYYRGVQVEANLLPKIQVDVVVSEVPVRKVIETAKKVLYTGHIGDGKIFVYDVENVVKVRTGEEGYDALQDVE